MVIKEQKVLELIDVSCVRLSGFYRELPPQFPPSNTTCCKQIVCYSHLAVNSRTLLLREDQNAMGDGCSHLSVSAAGSRAESHLASVWSLDEKFSIPMRLALRAPRGH